MPINGSTGLNPAWNDVPAGGIRSIIARLLRLEDPTVTATALAGDSGAVETLQEALGGGGSSATPAVVLATAPTFPNNEEGNSIAVHQEVNFDNITAPFTITVLGQTTGEIAVDATIEDIRDAVAALSSVNGNVRVYTGSPFTIEFVGALGYTPVVVTVNDNTAVKVNASYEAGVSPQYPLAVYEDTRGDDENNQDYSLSKYFSPYVVEGAFTISFRGQTTAPIAADATCQEICDAMALLSTIGAGNVQPYPGDENSTMADGNAVEIQFIGDLGLQYIEPFTANLVSPSQINPVFGSFAVVQDDANNYYYPRVFQFSLDGWVEISQVKRGTSRWLDLGVVTVADLLTGQKTIFTPEYGEKILQIRFGFGIELVDGPFWMNFYTDDTKRLGFDYGYGYVFTDDVRDSVSNLINASTRLNEADDYGYADCIQTKPVKVCLTFNDETAFPSVLEVATWQAAHAYSNAQRTAVCIVESGHIWTNSGGTSGGSAPDFAGNIGGTVTDNDITWTDRGAVPTVGSARVFIEVTTPESAPWNA